MSVVETLRRCVDPLLGKFQEETEQKKQKNPVMDFEVLIEGPTPEYSQYQVSLVSKPFEYRLYIGFTPEVRDKEVVMVPRVEAKAASQYLNMRVLPKAIWAQYQLYKLGHECLLALPPVVELPSEVA